MIDAAVFIQEPLLFKRKIKVYPPTVREVTTNPDFNLLYKLLTLTQEEIEKEVKPKLGEGEKMPTVLEYLILNCQFTNGFIQILNESFLFFCKSSINFDPNQMALILIDKEGQPYASLFEEDFFDFQNCVREVIGVKKIVPEPPPDPNEDPRITEIKRRARERDRIKAKQGNKNGLSFSTCLVAICCMGIGITPLNIGELSYASIGPIMNMMQEKEKYDIDVRSLLAGADSKKVKPKYWIREKDKE